MHPALASLDAEYAAIQERVTARFAVLDDAAMHRRPAPGSWSPGECLLHLAMTTDAFLPLLDAAMAGDPPAPDRRRRYRSSPVGWLLARALEPPVRRKFATTPPFVPDAARPAAEILAAFARSQAALRQRIAAADGRNLNRLRIRSPFNARLRYNVIAAFRVLAAHQRRHLWQAEEALHA